MAKHQADNGRRDGHAKAPNVPLAIAGAAILRQQFEKMRATEAGARRGDDDEATRHMRVAARRLRGALRIFVADKIRDAFAPVDAGSRAIEDALGVVRDLDVLRDGLRARIDTVPADAVALQVLLQALERVRKIRQDELRAVLDGVAARRFWETFPAALTALELAADPKAMVRTAGPRLLRRRLRKVIRSGRGLLAPTSSELHQLRIRCKRVRDVCEFFKPWCGQSVNPVFELARSLQDTLGALHDGDLAPESLQALVDVAERRGMIAPAGGYDLARATLGLVQDRRRERDELLLRFCDQWAELRTLKHASGF